MSTETDYDTKFYEEIEDGSRRSASALVPHVRRLLPKVESIVDFGCGNGVWLAEFERSGIEKIHGLDFGVGAGSLLAIKPENYRSANLGAPISVDQHDLCVCLEVAQHLVAEFSEVFVDNLVRSAPLVLFSAAIPNQGGHHHVNEQQPAYWISKFERRGYVCLDVVRPLIWKDDRIRRWYKQNVLLFVSRPLMKDMEALLSLPTFGGEYLVHPDSFQQCRQQLLNAAHHAPVGPSIAESEVNELLWRIKNSTFWKMSRPFHSFSTAAKRLNAHKF